MNTSPTSAPADHRLVIQREFDAPRDLVWAAWTDPGQIKTWVGLGEGVTVDSVRADLRAGGKFRFQQKLVDGEYYTAAGTYLEVDPPVRLVYTWDWEKDGAGDDFGELEGAETLVTVEFRAKGARTELVLTHEKFASVERRDRHVFGWNQWLDRMATYLGGNAGDLPKEGQP